MGCPAARVPPVRTTHGRPGAPTHGRGDARAGRPPTVLGGGRTRTGRAPCQRCRGRRLRDALRWSGLVMMPRPTTASARCVPLLPRSAPLPGRSLRERTIRGAEEPMLVPPPALRQRRPPRAVPAPQRAGSSTARGTTPEVARTGPECAAPVRPGAASRGRRARGRWCSPRRTRPRRGPPWSGAATRRHRRVPRRAARTTLPRRARRRVDHQREHSGSQECEPQPVPGGQPRHGRQGGSRRWGRQHAELPRCVEARGTRRRVDRRRSADFEGPDRTASPSPRTGMTAGRSTPPQPEGASVGSGRQRMIRCGELRGTRSTSSAPRGRPW